jgi:predicted ester cyclase
LLRKVARVHRREREGRRGTYGVKEMLLEANKEVVRRAYEEAWNNQNVDVLDKLLPVDYLMHTRPTVKDGREAIKNVIRAYHAAFPDLHVTIEDLVAEGDKVVMRGTWEGTHLGVWNTELFGPVQPTGVRAKWGGTHLFRVADGRIVESYYSTDFLSLFRQLGMIRGTQHA